MLVSFYITGCLMLGLILFGGFEETLKLVQYIELRIKTIWIEYRLWSMKRKLKQELDEWKSSQEH